MAGSEFQAWNCEILLYFHPGNCTVISLLSYMRSRNDVFLFIFKHCHAQYISSCYFNSFSKWLFGPILEICSRKHYKGTVHNSVLLYYLFQYSNVRLNIFLQSTIATLGEQKEQDLSISAWQFSPPPIQAWVFREKAAGISLSFSWLYEGIFFSSSCRNDSRARKSFLLPPDKGKMGTAGRQARVSWEHNGFHQHASLV